MKDIKEFKEMLRKLLFIMTKKQKLYALFLLGVIFVGSLFELLGVTAIIPFISSMISPDKLIENNIIKAIILKFNITNNINICIVLGFIIIIIYLVKNIYLTFSSYMQILFRCLFQKELSIKMLTTYMARPYTFFIKTNSSLILRGVGGAVSGVFAILDNLCKLVSEALTALLIGSFIIYTDPVMALGVLSLAILCFIFVTLGLKKKVSEIGRKEYKAVALKSEYTYQAIMGNKEIKVMQRSDYFVEKYSEAAEIGRKADVSYNFISILPERIIESVCVAALIGVVCIRLIMGVDIASFVPKLAAFAVAAFRILPSISRMTGYINQLIYFRPSLEDSYTNVKEVQEYTLLSKSSSNNLYETDAEFHKFRCNININNITWKYENSDVKILDNLSLEIQKGSSIAFIGESGAGKTTLADVILGLLRPESGTVTVDGKDIFNMPHVWAKLVGYVPQTVFLIDDTIRANIVFGLKQDVINEELIWKSLEEAQLDSFVKRLPEGLETIVGERGVKLSGGQRQRIAIARALYGNPEILVLDEATAALDNDTEKAVMESIDMLQGRKTLIIIAHRLSTIRKCNMVYEIKGGKAIKKDKEEILSLK